MDSSRNNSGTESGANSASARKTAFKNLGMTMDELRRRREENTVEIRKVKREDSLNKRRNLAAVASTPSSGLAAGGKGDVGISASTGGSGFDANGLSVEVMKHKSFFKLCLLIFVSMYLSQYLSLPLSYIFLIVDCKAC